MKVTTLDGHSVEVGTEEIRRAAHALGIGHNESNGKGNAEAYAKKTEEMMEDARKELKEMAGWAPHDWESLFEFAAEEIFDGDREDAHLVCNFAKIFYALAQKHTHAM